MSDAAPIPVILDCDPGVDDAIALIMALGASEAIELRAVTCVAGNVPLEFTVRNARRILELVGRTDIPVHAGSWRPIMRGEGRRSGAHGSDGLGGIALPEPAMPVQAENAVDAIIRHARATPGGIVLCPIGPLTNIALALLRDPELAAHVRQIVLMGGASFCPGNTTPLAEFNFHVDPHAAQIVYDSGIPIVQLGLDVTRQAVLSPDLSHRLACSGDAVRSVIGRMLGSYEARDPCLHDACVVAWLRNPDIFQSRPAYVEISLADGVAAGQSVTSVTTRHLDGRTPNCEVGTAVDAGEVERMLLNSLDVISPTQTE